MDKTYQCINCNKKYKLRYLNGECCNVLRCDKCDNKYKALEDKARKTLELSKAKAKKEKIKSLKGKDPFQVLAELKFLVGRTNKKSIHTPNGWWVSTNNLDGKESVLQECYDILDAYDIPSKYLIVESLDQDD